MNDTLISSEITTRGGIQFNTKGKFCKGNIQAIPKLQTKTATSNGTITQDTGYCGLSSVVVNVASPTLSGSATAENVLSGKTFYNTSTTLQTGTMTNNGAISGEISTKTGSFSIPSGYTTGGSVAISSTEQAKLLPANIKTNTTILGVTGTYTGDGTPVNIATAAEMDALLISSNVGKIYRFTGTTDTTYTNGGLYEVIA